MSKGEEYCSFYCFYALFPLPLSCLFLSSHSVILPCFNSYSSCLSISFCSFVLLPLLLRLSSVLSFNLKKSPYFYLILPTSLLLLLLVHTSLHPLAYCFLFLLSWSSKYRHAFIWLFSFSLLLSLLLFRFFCPDLAPIFFIFLSWSFIIRHASALLIISLCLSLSLLLN